MFLVCTIWYALLHKFYNTYCLVLFAQIIDDGYILNFDSPIYVCSDEDSQKFIETSRVEVKRHNETTTYMTGSIEFLKGIQTATMVFCN